MGRIIIFPKSYIKYENECSKVELPNRPNRCPNCHWLNLKGVIVPDNCKWCSDTEKERDIMK